MKIFLKLYFFFKVEKSPLFAQLESFLPEFASSTKRLQQLPAEEKEKLSMEVVDEETERVVEMTVLASDNMQDSPIFHLLNLQQNSEVLTTTEQCFDTSDSESDSSNSSSSSSNSDGSDSDKANNDSKTDKKNVKSTEKISKQLTKKRMIEEVEESCCSTEEKMVEVGNDCKNTSMNDDKVLKP